MSVPGGGPRAQNLVPARQGKGSVAQDLIGKVVDGRYLVQRKVGQGSLGTVYEATHTSLTQKVAVKVLIPSIVALVGDADQFLATVRAASKVRHRNIVDVREFGKLDNTVYVAMDFVSGPTLKDVLKEQGPIPWRWARAVILQIAGALKAAHKRGVLHRGFHPGNCFVLGKLDAQPQPVIKVSDFTLANNGFLSIKSSTSKTTARFVGKPTYAAPELKNVEPSVESDIYACGVLLYQMLTGEPPFDGGTAFQIMSAHAERPVPLPRDKVPAIPEEVEAVILQALAKDPQKRFASAQELEMALKEISADAEGDTSETNAAAEQTATDVTTDLKPEVKNRDAKAPARDEAMHEAFDRLQNEPAELGFIFDARQLAPYFGDAAEQLGLLPHSGASHGASTPVQPIAQAQGASHGPSVPMQPIAQAQGASHGPSVPMPPVAHAQGASHGPSVPMQPVAQVRGADVESAFPTPTVRLDAVDVEKKSPQQTVHFEHNTYRRVPIPPTEHLAGVTDGAASRRSARAIDPTVYLSGGGLPDTATSAPSDTPPAPVDVSVGQGTLTAPAREVAVSTAISHGHGQGTSAIQVHPPASSSPPQMTRGPRASGSRPIESASRPSTLPVVFVAIIAVSAAIAGALVGLALACPPRETSGVQPSSLPIASTEPVQANHGSA